MVDVLILHSGNEHLLFPLKSTTTGERKTSSYCHEKVRQFHQYENFIILKANFNKYFCIVNTKIVKMNWNFHEIALSWNSILRLFTSKWFSPEVSLNSKIPTLMVRNREENHY